jgi:hypothetical protein
MKRIMPMAISLVRSGLLLLALGFLCSGCSSEKTQKRSSQGTPAPAATAAPATPIEATPKATTPDPATLPPPPVASGYRIFAPDERPSEEACKQACEHILALAVADVPAHVRETAEAYAAKIAKSCPQNCRETGTRASVACTNAATTYDVARSCPTAKYR